MSATLSEATGRPYGIQRCVRRGSARARRSTPGRHASSSGTRARSPHGGSDAHGVGRDAAGGDSGRSRPLAVPGRGPSEGPRAAADRGRDPGRADAGAAGAAGAQAALPAPRPQGTARVHAGTIVTQAPNVMWGTDGVRVFTLDDGLGLDLHSGRALERGVCGMARVQGWEPGCGARADRPGLRRIYGALDADSARGLALRMDHGSQYLSDHFLNQIRYWGMRPSYGFVEEPETNGVAERWNRTLKEQATHGRIFQNLKEVRDAVTAFVERYNTTWRLEKLGYHTPIEAREAHELRRAA